MNTTIFRLLVKIFLLIIVVGLIGQVIVLPVIDQIEFSFCNKYTDGNDKAVCERASIKNSLTQGNTLLAMNMFKVALKNTAIDCHTLGHQVGRDTYNIMKKKGLTRITDPLPDCGYGFWHGFMSGFTNDLANGEKPKIEIMDVCKKMLGTNTDIYGVCYHGLGLGFVGDPPQPMFWGKPKETIENGIKKCSELTSDSYFHEECVSGVFHQTLWNMSDNLYGFALPKGEALYSFCNDYGKENSSACLGQFGSIIATYLHSGVDQEIKTINTKFSWLSEDQRSYFIGSVVAGYISIATDLDTKSGLVSCLHLNTFDRQNCLGGVFVGVTNKTKGGDIAALNYMFDICDQGILTKEDKDNCVSFLATYPRNEITKTEIKNYCSKSKEGNICKLILPNL